MKSKKASPGRKPSERDPTLPRELLDEAAAEIAENKAKLFDHAVAEKDGFGYFFAAMRDMNPLDFVRSLDREGARTLVQYAIVTATEIMWMMGQARRDASSVDGRRD